MIRKMLLAVMVLSAAAPRGYGQSPFSTRDSININNINELILVHGDMGWDPDLEIAHCYFPAGSPASINFDHALWMSGYDGGGNLHIAAQTYRQIGNDYWPGPLDASDTLTYATSHDWAKIWKVNRSDIDYFRSLSSFTTSTTPQAILTWPGTGNTYAQGNGGVSLSVTGSMAPFVDLNHNGIYEPLLGEYPDIKGDQALWYVFSDNGPTHGETRGRPLGVEVHAMIYAYHRGTLLDNVVYYDFNIVNKSGNTYNNFRLGLFDDIDLGYYNDDYIGFDSTRRLGLCYNGNDDDGLTASHPANSYGTHIPMVGVTWIQLPGDGVGGLVPAGSFIYYQNDPSVIGNPLTDTEYNFYLRSRMRNGNHFKNDYAGPGVISTAMGTGPDCNYIFTGDPSNTAQWSECACGNIPGDRRFVMASNDFTIAAGASNHIVMALVATNPDTMNGCPNSGLSAIRAVSDTAWNNYYNPPAAPSLVNAPGQLMKLNIYPNPAHDRIVIEVPATRASMETITLFNSMGQVMDAPVQTSGRKMIADISLWPPGIYTVQYHSENEVVNTLISKN